MMKFKISQHETKHKNVVTCIGWNNTEELYSCGDDHQLIRWNVVSGEALIVTTFNENFFPTGLHIFPKVGPAGSKQSQDNLLITTADGRFHIISQTGRIEKSVSAHEGACLAGHWSPDGAGFLTAGEDGLVKVWSRSGLARSVLSSAAVPVYCAAWGPTGSAILHAQSNILVITHLQGNSSTIQWRAHERLILSVAWNSNNNLILSGSEDGRYKTWDTFGQQLSCSVRHESPIMSVAWTPAGDLFAIAGYNLLRLCDHTGWSHCLERFTTGGIQSIVWSSDSTQVAVACANGNVLFAHVIQRQLEWKNYTCALTGRKVITIKDIISDITEQLDFPNRVIQMRMSHGHLVVVTSKQCYIHSVTSWNTPVIFDLKEGAICMIQLSERCFCLVERSSVNVYNYLGRLLASPKWGSMRLDTLASSSITLGPDSMAVIDQNDSKIVHIFELSTGLAVRSTSDHSVASFSHSMAVTQVAMSQSGPPTERQLAFLDFNRDLYTTLVKDTKVKLHKLAVQVGAVLWCEDAAILVGLKEGKILIFGCPRVPAFLNLTTVNKDVSDLGKNPTLLSVEEGRVVVRRGDGAILHIAISPFPVLLARKIAANQWSHALKLCRIIKDETLWACLAALSWEHRELDVAEEAFAIIKQPHQVEYIQHLKNPALKEIM